jgi:hypothetical protein
MDFPVEVKLTGLKQPPLNTTMMGVLHGAAGFLGLNPEVPMLFGLSGHAFLINIHRNLCPSGPYCWHREKTDSLLENIGVRIIDLGFFGPDSTREQRGELEGRVRAYLDGGTPCALLNMENQLITGYDREGFIAAQPWAPACDFPSGRLAFGSWSEFGDEVHASFFALEKTTPAPLESAIIDCLGYAVDLWRNPGAHSFPDYGIGPQAYDNWTAAVPAEGSSHGNWWNAAVWSECRGMAAEFFKKVGVLFPAHGRATDRLHHLYAAIAGNLEKAGDKSMPVDEKAGLLQRTMKMEDEAISVIEQLAEAVQKAAPRTTSV